MEFQLEHPLSHSLHHSSMDTPDHAADPSDLFLIESQHMPSFPYFHSLNLSLRPETISSILQYSREFYDPYLTYLAVNYLDRFLSSQDVLQPKPWILRLISLSCVSLAAKMRKPNSSVSDFQEDGGLIFDTQTVERMENVILGALKWRMRSITPFSFLSFFLNLFEPTDPMLRHSLRTRATGLTLDIQHDAKFLGYKPSVVAAAALLVASWELCPLQFPCFSNAISQCSYVNKDEVMECYNAMQESVGSSGETAVNVGDDDHHFSSSESDNSVTSEATPPKRRKIPGPF